MTHLSLQLRTLWWRGLYALLFPLVFVATWFETTSQESRDNVIKAFGSVLLMTLGLACAAAIAGRL